MTHTLRFTLSMWIQDTPRYLLYYGRAVLSINQANTVNIERTKGPPCQATESGHFSADTHTSTIKPLFEIAIFFSSVKRGFPECVFLGLGLVEGFPLLDFSARPTDCRESSYMTLSFFPLSICNLPLLSQIFIVFSVYPVHPITTSARTRQCHMLTPFQILCVVLCMCFCLTCNSSEAAVGHVARRSLQVVFIN